MHTLARGRPVLCLLISHYEKEIDEVMHSRVDNSRAKPGWRGIGGVGE